MSTAPLFDDPASGAVISACGRYRYRLWRVWEAARPRLLWVMLNPSTADAANPDPTIRKCIGFARRHGYGSIEVVNLFALRATDPKELRAAKDPEGFENDVHIVEAARRAGPVIMAWGGFRFAPIVPRARRVYDMIRHYRPSTRFLCLGRTGTGAPAHPLMLAYATPLEDYEP